MLAPYQIIGGPGPPAPPPSSYAYVMHLAEELEVLVSIPGRPQTFVEIDHEISSAVISPFPLIQTGQLLVTGKSMGT